MNGMIRTLLIANRGEIACRIARSAKALGIRTVAVHSDADARAMHVAHCDRACRIGPAPASDSYLNAGAIIEAARASGADAVHPGYGFLAENAEFADACADAGLTFVGPPAQAIRDMGSKARARALMETAGVALVPGYHGEDQDAAALGAAAARIGYPVLVKASAGGGGRGMRIVATAGELAPAIDSARREAAAAFGDGRLLIEKYLSRPRHVEVQVFGDGHGTMLHLFERDCSIQRRHQKVLEEAPAPGLPDDLRAALGETAVRAARAVGYVGAGTVEFVLDANGFYFIEMNTRLQVEHPVTEAVTGIDLVAWQLDVAAGGRLPLAQDQVRCRGHALEARLCAEDPVDFQPRTGQISYLRFPGDGTRVDTGVREGDAVSVYYDAMIAKLVAHGPDRATALSLLARAVEQTRVAGLVTNQPFLARLVHHPAFARGDVHTGFIEEHADALLPAPAPVDDTTFALAATAVVRQRAHAAQAGAAATADPGSPWHSCSGWRLNAPAVHRVTLAHGEEQREVLLEVAGRDLVAAGLRLSGGVGPDEPVTATGNGGTLTAPVVLSGQEVTVFLPDGPVVLAVHDPLEAAGGDEEAAGHLTAPMPGRIIEIHVTAGDDVVRGTPLLVLEAMKMEHTITAPVDGTVTRVRYAVGDLVEEGSDLLELEPARGE